MKLRYTYKRRGRTRRLPLLLLAAFSLAFLPGTVTSACGQTFVAVTPSTRVVVMEEFTGVKCSNCPDGHKISDAIEAKYAEHFFAINLHYSSLGAPSAGEADMRTPFADKLANVAQVGGIPLATIDRTKFNGATLTAVDRSKWEECVQKESEKIACVNLAAQTTIDYLTREMTCTVEAYYTKDNIDEANDFLHIALLQNNVIASQVNGGSYPEMSVGNGKYRHNHILRTFITGEDGDTIPNSSAGSFFTKTYIIPIPDKYGDLAFDIGNMDVVLFITSGNGTVLNGAESEVFIKNAPSRMEVLKAENAHVKTCENEGSAKVLVKNTGKIRLDRLDFAMTVNGITDTTSWLAGKMTSDGKKEKYIAPGKEGWCTLPVFDVYTDKENNVSVQLIGANGGSISEDIREDSLKAKCVFTKKVYFSLAELKTIKIVLNVDQYGSEISWKLYNTLTREVIKDTAYDFNLDVPGIKTYEHTIRIPGSACYAFEIYDANGDGINNGFGQGSYQIYDDKNNVLTRSDGVFAKEDYRVLSLEAPMSNEEDIFFGDPTLDAAESVGSSYIFSPNPTRGLSTFSFTLNRSQRQVMLRVYDLGGRLMKSIYEGSLEIGKHAFNCSIAELPKGVYILHLQSESVHHIEKINKN